ncbi:MAG: ATP-grasp domain-containing protein [Methylocella sp.]
MKTTATAGRKILFLTLGDWPGSIRLLAEFGRLGCACAVMSPPGFTTATTRFAAAHFRLPRHRGLALGLLAARFRLEQANRAWRPDLIVPLDDTSAWLLRGLTTDRSVSVELRHLLEVSLGSPAGYGAACSRTHFLELATRIGVRAPASRTVDRAEALKAAAAMDFPVMVKSNQTTGGQGVTIARDPAELAASIEASGLGRGELLRRSEGAARRFVWRLAGVWTPPGRIFELQQFIPGVPAMRIVAAWQGRVLAGVSFLKACVNPQPFGPGTVVRFLDHPEMEATATRLVAALGLSGFAHFDFVIAEDGGGAFVIELNPRTTGAIHLGRPFGHDLCGALARHLGWPAETPETVELPKEAAIALFPNEIARDPESTWLRSGSGALHDVPWDDPGVVEHCYRHLLQVHPRHAAKIAHLLCVKDHSVETSA